LFAQQCKVEIEIVWMARGIRSDCEWDARTAKISHYANVQFIFEWGAEFDQPALTISTSWRGLCKPRPKAKRNYCAYAVAYA